MRTQPKREPDWRAEGHRLLVSEFRRGLALAGCRSGPDPERPGHYVAVCPCCGSSDETPWPLRITPDSSVSCGNGCRPGEVVTAVWDALGYPGEDGGS
jgi:hypothetical protein